MMIRREDIEQDAAGLINSCLMLGLPREAAKDAARQQRWPSPEYRRRVLLAIGRQCKALAAREAAEAAYAAEAAARLKRCADARERLLAEQFPEAAEYFAAWDRLSAQPARTRRGTFASLDRRYPAVAARMAELTDA